MRAAGNKFSREQILGRLTLATFDYRSSPRGAVFRNRSGSCLDKSVPM
jgi:hypothetical protein